MITVLGSGPAAPRLVTGAARLRAARALLAQARASFDLVIVDCPALLQIADATELVNAVDAAIIVVNPDDSIPDHLEMADWLTQCGSDVIGYVYNRAQMRSPSTRHRGGVSATRTRARRCLRTSPISNRGTTALSSFSSPRGEVNLSSSSLLSRDPSADALLDLPSQAQGGSGRCLPSLVGS